MITVEKVEDVPVKYVFTEKTLQVDGHKLHQIKAVRDFGNVKVGELGGYIESEYNLSHFNKAWVYPGAKVFGSAMVSGNASVSDCAWIYGNAKIIDEAQVFGSAEVYDNAIVHGRAKVSQSAYVYGCAEVLDNAQIYGRARVHGKARVCGDAEISLNANILNTKDYACVKGFGEKYRTTTFCRTFCGMVIVKCGCFYGTIPEFRVQVKRTRDGKIAKEYLMIADLMEYHFDKGDEDED